MNIILIGMRGSGKTTVGKALATRLSRDFIETDREIEHKTGVSIGEFVKNHGWDAFRDIEEKVVKDASKLDNVVVATGGGVVERASNIDHLKSKGVLVWLLANPSTYVKRIEKDGGRPFLTKANNHADDVRSILASRKNLYAKAADVIVNSENKTVNEIIDEIIEEIKTYD